MSAVAARNGNPETRQAIIQALSRLLEREPLESVTVSEILAEAGLSSRTTFYRQFTSRDEAFIALAEDRLAETRRILEAVINDPGVRSSPEIRQAVTIWMSRAGRHRGLIFRVLAEWPRVPALKHVFLRFMEGLIETAAQAIEADREAGLVVSDLPGDRLAAMSLWAAERTVYATLVEAKGFEDAHAVADVLVGIHLGVTYGVKLPAAARDASRAAWLMA
jgi:AcrR family transcriptional regulator